MLDAGAAVVHLPDFFGPEVHTSTVQLALEQAAAGETVQWLGKSNVPREAAYAPDAMRIVADLSEHDEAYGTDWCIPGSGTLTADQLARIPRTCSRTRRGRFIPHSVGWRKRKGYSVVCQDPT